VVKLYTFPSARNARRMKSARRCTSRPS